MVRGHVEVDPGEEACGGIGIQLSRDEEWAGVLRRTVRFGGPLRHEGRTRRPKKGRVEERRGTRRACRSGALQGLLPRGVKVGPGRGTSWWAIAVPPPRTARVRTPTRERWWDLCAGACVCECAYLVVKVRTVVATTVREVSEAPLETELGVSLRRTGTQQGVGVTPPIGGER